MQRVIVNLRVDEGEPGDPDDRYFEVSGDEVLDVRILDNGALRVAVPSRTVTFAPGAWATCVSDAVDE